MAEIDPAPVVKPNKSYTLYLRNRFWLSARTFEIELSRPDGFAFIPGQRIRFTGRSQVKDYSLISIPSDPFLSLCIRKVEDGDFSPRLAHADMDTPFDISGPYGYFTHRRSTRSIVLVATGTGISPFVSMVRSGLKDFTLLHGVRSPEELYYASLFQAAAAVYVPCLSGGDHMKEGFSGRVTDYLNTRLPVGSYDFYLCGSSRMIRDVTLIVDDRFPESYVYTEIYY